MRASHRIFIGPHRHFVRTWHNDPNRRPLATLERRNRVLPVLHRCRRCDSGRHAPVAGVGLASLQVVNIGTATARSPASERALCAAIHVTLGV